MTVTKFYMIKVTILSPNLKQSLLLVSFEPMKKQLAKKYPRKIVLNCFKDHLNIKR